MNFVYQNNNTRAFYSQDFSCFSQLFKMIRDSLLYGNDIDLSDIDLSSFIDFNPRLTRVFVSLFQPEISHMRVNSLNDTLQDTLNKCLSKLRAAKRFSQFDVNDENKCTIMLEWYISKREVDPKKLIQSKFNSMRFEIGINGIELNNRSNKFFYTPTDAVVFSNMGLTNALNLLLRKTPIRALSNRFSERIKIFYNDTDYKTFLTTTRAVVSHKNTCLPLYRCNKIYNEFSFDELIKQFQTSVDWLVKNMQDDGRFLYYYDCTNDTTEDHEHPNRPENDRYYNDLRHCGGAISLIRAYNFSADSKYLEYAKKALDFTVSISKRHEVDNCECFYPYYNRKSKLGGVGMALIAMMQYRIYSGDKSYDKFIKGYVRHLLSRITPDGEFLGYFIHPSYHNGEPLHTLSDDERMETFSFYYPGEALLGLGLFANNFNDDSELEKLVVEKTKVAMDWIVDERPKHYSHLFTPLPSDAWLMQAIEEWADYPNFIQKNHIQFVYNDANEMMSRMYKRDDSPYIDFEGGMYYEYGDHYYPDGARCEGLIAAYYLAKKLGDNEFADKILNAAKLAARCQFQLYNSEETSFVHKVPQKTIGAIRFKATRQWVRVDSIQHVACFFIRLYWTKFPMSVEKVCNSCKETSEIT